MVCYVKWSVMLHHQINGPVETRQHLDAHRYALHSQVVKLEKTHLGLRFFSGLARVCNDRLLLVATIFEVPAVFAVCGGE